MKRIILLFITAFIAFNANAQWTDDIVNSTPIFTGYSNQSSPVVYTFPDGTTYISCLSFENDGGQVTQRYYLKKFSATGLPQWPGNGMIVCDKPSLSFSDNYSMEGLSDGNMLLFTKDLRKQRVFKYSETAIQPLNDVFIYKVSPDQTSVWDSEGIQLNNSRDKVGCVLPSFVVLDNGSVLATWSETLYDGAKNPSAFVFKKVSTKEGTILATDSIKPANTDTTYLKMNTITTVGGSTITSYFANTGGNVPRMLGIIGHDENLKRTFNSVVYAKTGVPNAGDMKMVADDEGGVYVLFAYVTRASKSAIKVQHFNNKGIASYPEPLFVANDTVHYEYSNPTGYFNKQKRCLTVFYASLENVKKTETIDVQEFNKSGFVTDVVGKTVMNYPVETGLVCNKAILLENGHSLLIYQTLDVNSKIRAVRFDMNYGEVWRKIVANYHPDLGKTSVKTGLTVGDIAGNQVVMAWRDERISTIFSGDVYAQNLQIDGFIGNKGVLEVIPGRLILTVGDTLHLKSILQPEGISLNATYKSNYPNLVSVDQYGAVKANAYGEAVITVSAFNGAQSIQIPVQILDTPYDNEGIHVFNGFSPNNDGSNDVFYIQNIDRFPGNKLTVLDAGGQIRYEVVDYNNSWNGIATVGPYKGNLLPSGTYYYVLELPNGSKKKGYVIIKY
ncbi:hypothetical protein D3C80_381430 [compost metagenome]